MQHTFYGKLFIWKLNQKQNHTSWNIHKININEINVINKYVKIITYANKNIRQEWTMLNVG